MLSTILSDLPPSTTSSSDTSPTPTTFTSPALTALTSPSPPLSPPDSPPFPPPQTHPKRTPSFHLILPLPPPALTPLSDEADPRRKAIMDGFFPHGSEEAEASAHVHEHIHHDPQIGARMMGLSAAPAAVGRFLSGESLYILPESADELRDVLGRFARDVIHSLISQAKTRIEEGGYTLARQVAMRSLRDRVLRSPRGVEVLLAVHRKQESTPGLVLRDGSGTSSESEGEGEGVRTPPPPPPTGVPSAEKEGKGEEKEGETRAGLVSVE